MVFWPQFLHVNTALSRMAKVYGPSGHSEPMRINVRRRARRGSRCVHLADSYDRDRPRACSDYPALIMAHIPLNPGIIVVSRATGHPLQIGHPRLVVVHPIVRDPHGMYDSGSPSCLVRGCCFGCRGPRAEIGWIGEAGPLGSRRRGHRPDDRWESQARSRSVEVEICVRSYYARGPVARPQRRIMYHSILI